MLGLRHVPEPTPGAMVLKLEPASESPAGLVETWIAGPHPGDSDSDGLEGGMGWGLRMCFSNNGDSAGWRPHFENQ